MTDSPQVFFFGCAKGVHHFNGVGHYAYKSFTVNGHPRMQTATWCLEGLVPAAISARIDGGWTPRRRGYPHGDADQGQALVSHVEGWTVLAFWDRSGDSRGGSHSTYVMEGEVDFAEALARAREAFPELFARYPFPIEEADPHAVICRARG